MKRSNEYFEWFKFDRDHHLGLGDVRLTIAEQEELIKQIQLDTVEETVKLCAKNAKIMCLNAWQGEYIVDEQSILDCTEILKKEIDEE